MKDIFISHSSADKRFADSVVTALEANEINCWIAPRDIPAGCNYGAEIAKGIRECEILILIFSENSHSSTAVFREVQMAFNERKAIIPLRIQEIPPGDDLSFYLSGLHWLDVSPEKLNFENLLKDVSLSLKNARAKAESPAPPPSAPPVQPAPVVPQKPAAPASTKNALIIAASIVFCFMVGLVVFLVLRDSTPQQPDFRAFAPRETATETPEGSAAHTPADETPEHTPAPQSTPINALFHDYGCERVSGYHARIGVRGIGIVDSLTMGEITHYNALRFMLQTTGVFLSAAPNIRQYALFNLGGEYRTFNGYIGSVANTTQINAALRIYGDNELLLSQEIRGRDTPTQISLSVAGFDSLRVQLSYGTSYREANIQWGLVGYFE